ncbi:GNAT family N-acetyltransferase [Salinibacillus xinjiangensis]|uniref:GNAT family N-acetyltransferase n=1 Tax=Salinibacillus xinjiangensis TaxID=1229268 RepID=A0A6G1X560_9BACI|nr:GNAT family N-acetyltransferase [Salinibacillus xinjiangensis]MRG86077.1 GNAT family N-acetyltransferase [Salinibacillus xinjiangensis]
MSVFITKLTPEHTEAVASICASGWRQTVEGMLSEEYQRKNVEFWYNHERVERDILAGVYQYVALIDSKVVGVIGGGMTSPEKGEIFVLYVDETYRYQGIGRRLLDMVTAEQKELGISEQWVSVQEGNQYGIPFYEARGFEFQEKKITVTETNEKQVSLRYARQLA